MRHSLSDQAYAMLKREIITCALAPGQQIVQRQIADWAGLGTTPVREALQRLSQEGLLQPIPRFGYLVSPITLSDVHEIYELRSVLEAAAARLAAQRGTPEQLTAVARAANFGYVFQDRQTYIEFLARNTSFHQSIALLAGNRRLAGQIAHLLDEMTRIFHLGLDLRDSADEMRAEHVELAQALRERDPEAAERLVRSQIARSQERVLEALSSRSLAVHLTPAA